MPYVWLNSTKTKSTTKKNGVSKKYPSAQYKKWRDNKYKKSYWQTKKSNASMDHSR